MHDQSNNHKLNLMEIPTEPIGSIPRPRELQDAMIAHSQGKITPDDLNVQFDKAVRETIERFEATGSPIVSDGEQTKSSFATYPLDGLDNVAADRWTYTSITTFDQGTISLCDICRVLLTSRKEVRYTPRKAGGYIRLCHEFAVSERWNSELFTRTIPD